MSSILVATATKVALTLLPIVPDSGAHHDRRHLPVHGPPLVNLKVVGHSGRRAVSLRDGGMIDDAVCFWSSQEEFVFLEGGIRMIVFHVFCLRRVTLESGFPPSCATPVDIRILSCPV